MLIIISKCKRKLIMTKDDFIEKAKSIHGNKYNYEKVVYKNSKTKVIIMCHKHGEFQQAPNDHQNGRGCKKCGTDKRKMSMETFIERSKKAHGDKYDYSLVVYEGQYKKVNIICPNHGVFKQTPKNHWICGCNECGYDKIKDNNEKERSKTIQLAKDFRKKHSAVETAKKFEVSQSFLSRHKIFDKITENRLDLPDELSNEQEQFLFGNMLGDGCIPWSNIGNTSFCINQKSDKIEYLEGLSHRYNPFSLNIHTRKIKKPSTENGTISHKNWNGEYLISSKLYTHSHPYFSKLRSKWYAEPNVKKSIKIIPPDLVLTWRMASTWMCDDGSNHCDTGRYLMLHTESFSDEDVNFLIHKLKENLNIKSKMNRHDGKPTIRIAGDSWYRFIENISEFIPWSCFQYKLKKRKAPPPKSKSGYLGVMQRKNRWVAYKSYRINGRFKSIIIGNFNTLEEAAEARSEWLVKNDNFRDTLKI